MNGRQARGNGIGYHFVDFGVERLDFTGVDGFPDESAQMAIKDTETETTYLPFPTRRLSRSIASLPTTRWTNITPAKEARDSLNTAFGFKSRLFHKAEHGL